MAKTHSNELVSIIIPTFNRAAVLEEAILSVAAQTYRPIELIIIDDGSTDQTKDAVSKLQLAWSAEDFFIRYIHQENRGVSAARNRGLKELNGKFVQYLDSDDLIDTKKIEFQIDAFNLKPTAGVVIGTSRDLATGTKVKLADVCNSANAQRASVTAWTLPTNNPLLRASVCQVLGMWDERMKCFEDASYMAGIYFRNIEVVSCETAVSYIRGHSLEWHETYPGRVSFRGEPERVREHLLSLYLHQKNIFKYIDGTRLLDDQVSNIAERERLRVGRLLFIEGLISEANDLFDIRGSSPSFRLKVEKLTLKFFCELFGYKRGAKLHLKIHDALFFAKSALFSSAEEAAP